MKYEVIVVLDLGCFKAYKILYDTIGATPQLELIENFNTDAHKRLGEQLTDVAGRFRGGSPSLKGVRAYGEKHNFELEFRKRMIKQLAKKLNNLIKAQNDGVHWHLAASKEIYHEILKRLDVDVKTKLKINVAEDLTHLHQEDLLDHFLELKEA